jgi:hypothetical protein
MREKPNLTWKLMSPSFQWPFIPGHKHGNPAFSRREMVDCLARHVNQNPTPQAIIGLVILRYLFTDDPLIFSHPEPAGPGLLYH